MTQDLAIHVPIEQPPRALTQQASAEQPEPSCDTVWGVVAWLWSAVGTIVVILAVVAVLVLEYAALWAVVVAPWLRSLPPLPPLY